MKIIYQALEEIKNILHSVNQNKDRKCKEWVDHLYKIIHKFKYHVYLKYLMILGKIV